VVLLVHGSQTARTLGPRGDVIIEFTGLTRRLWVRGDSMRGLSSYKHFKR
jgi:hypothetical protein